MHITTICPEEEFKENQLGDFAFPIGITAEYIAGFALRGQ